METLSSFLTHDHRRCDEGCLDAERHVAEGRWPEAQGSLAAFVTDMRRHFAREEEVLFPAFEAATGLTAGPTAVMRMEHRQIEQLMASLQDALAGRDREEYLGVSETLLMLLQQHNAKEENILYPTADRSLTDAGAGLLERMQAM
jgi:iron-sulfur cluster repair protein YtfE (RIC family)